MVDAAQAAVHEMVAPGAGCGGGGTGGSAALSDRPSMVLDFRAVPFDRGLLSRNLRQCVQPDGADGRVAQAGYRHFRGALVLQSRHGAAGAAVRVYRMAAVGSALAAGN